MDTYEKKYKEAQKWIESIYSELSHEQQMEAEAFFPELKESEDERISKEIIKYLERTVPHHHRDEVLKSKEWTAWLEKQGELKPWSEEDEKKLIGICNYISCSDSPEGFEEWIDWLNSLKDRYTWKPSDEQIGVIEAIINNRSFQRRHLNSLYEQLKKLT